MKLFKRSHTDSYQPGKLEELFWLLQPDRRTPGSTLRALKS